MMWSNELERLIMIMIIHAGGATFRCPNTTYSAARNCPRHN